MNDGRIFSRYLLGVCFGQTQNYTAIAAVKHFVHHETKEARYEIVSLERAPLGTSYSKIVDYIVSMLKAPEFSGLSLNGTQRARPELVVDVTGTGSPIVGLLKDRGAREHAHLVSCVITSGSTLTMVGAGYGVPVKDLVSTLQTLFQDGRIKVAEDLKLGSVLVKELLNFKAKPNTNAASDTYEAWREKDHDDLVFAVALPIWWANTYRKYSSGGWLPPVEAVTGGHGYNGPYL